MFQFKKISPSPYLKNFFSGYWLIINKDSSALEEPLLLIPDGHPELFFSLKQQFKFKAKQEIIDFPKRGFIGQLSKNFQLISQKGSVGLFVKMYPYTPYLLTKTPQNLLKNGIVELGNLMNNVELNELHEKIFFAQDLTIAIKVLEDFLWNKINNNLEVQPILNLIIKKIFNSGGKIPVKKLTEGINFSARYLEKLFQQQIGLSPNQYTRLIQLKKASIALSENPPKNFSSFALENGFYDHAHFTRNFKKLAGITPSEFVEYSKSFPIQEKKQYLHQWDF